LEVPTAAVIGELIDIVAEQVGYFGLDQEVAGKRATIFARADRNAVSILTVIIRQMASFFMFGERARADDPTWIGVRQLAVQRVWS
jgi:hypothetical protein